jgi:hypothetical protein
MIAPHRERGRPASPAPRSPEQRRDVVAATFNRYESAVAVAIAMGIGIALMLRMPEPISGPDGGNWLALSGALVGAQSTAASIVYPPGFLAMLVALRTIAPPLTALTIAAALVSALPGLACFWLLRFLGCGRLALVGLCASLIGFALEMLAWGGYPQLMGSGFVLGALAFQLGGYKTGRSAYFVVAGVLGGLTLLSHHLAGLQVIVCLGTFAAVALVAPRTQFVRRVRWTVLLFVVLGVTALPGASTYLGLLTRAGPSAFNANGFDLPQIIEYLTNDGPVLWLAIAAAVPCALGVRLSQRAWDDVGALLALAVASVGLALFTYELRTGYLALVLGLVSFVIVGQWLISRGFPTLKLVTGLAAGAFIFVVVLAGVYRFDRSVRFYSVLDPAFVEGFEWLNQHREPGDLAVVTPGGHRKWPLGWWVQGLGRVPSYLDYDPRWLYFREEKEQAQIARTILENDDPQAAAAEAQRNGVTLLLFDAREQGQAEAWLRSGRVFGDIGLIYSNPSLAIFRVARAVPVRRD